MKIEVTHNGPYKVTGLESLLAPDGTTIDLPAGEAVFLCRCGGSTNKPFCDGTHSRTGFDGAMHAVRDADAG